MDISTNGQRSLAFPVLGFIFDVGRKAEAEAPDTYPDKIQEFNPI